MHLITAEIQNYIRCSKMLWNEYYRALPDGEHDFTDVQRLVWETLVIKLLQDTRVDISDGEIIVMPKPLLTTVLVGRSSQNETAVSWQEEPRGLKGHVFLFTDFFDFRDWQGPREMKFVECWNTRLPKEHLLIPTSEVDFYYRARQPN
jgi:hypothetical protein